MPMPTLQKRFLVTFDNGYTGDPDTDYAQFLARILFNLPPPGSARVSSTTSTGIESVGQHAQLEGFNYSSRYAPCHRNLLSDDYEGRIICKGNGIQLANDD
ncbi:MAG: hypothetical protein Q9226_004862 [Calogaya cf. arnoldii]